MHKVIIIGGGPVGLSAAICLAYQGIGIGVRPCYCYFLAPKFWGQALPLLQIELNS